VLVPFHSIEEPSILQRLLEATLLIESKLELPQVLRHVLEEACSMTGARYGALGVLDEGKRTLAEFLTLGLSAEQERAIGPRPTGRGVLGLLIAEPTALRLTDISSHLASAGFPANHPPMASFLGTPIKVRDEVYGNLYLTEKEGSAEFTEDDVAVTGALALAAGIAIENARLHERVRRSAVFEDRDRMARDLHDTVIQRLFGLGLTLQGIAARLPASASRQLEDLVSELDGVIAQVRSTIYELGMGDRSRGVRDDILALVSELPEVAGFEANVTFDGPLDTLVTPQLREHLLAIVREALTNVAKHAHATQASVHVDVDEATCRLVISDNGMGMGAPSSAAGGGLGLPNLRRRAEKLGGTFVVGDAPAGGTVLTWQVPLGR
jgi:signal transduction histidine kinase